MKIKDRVRHSLSPVFLLLGLALLVYVGAEYGHMYFEQRHLELEWRLQQKKPSGKVAGENTDGDGLTRISAPRINLDSIIVQGDNDNDLLLGPGHMPNTPDPGDPGNAVISGHRDTFFRHIHELEKGDTLLIRRDGKTFRYVVTGKKIVSATDVSVLQPTRDSRMTLITCYPTYYIGPAPERLVVFSKLVGDTQAPAKAEQTAAAASSSH